MSQRARECAASILEAVPAVMRGIRRHMRSHRLKNLSVPQFRVLAYLERSGPATLSEAAEQVGTTRPSMSRMIQSLVEAKLVHRQSGTVDRRTVRLELTPEGHRVFEVARKGAMEEFAGRIEAFTSEEIEQLHTAMPLLLRVAAGGEGPCGCGKRKPRC